PLHAARHVEFRIEAAGRHAEGAGCAARSAGAGRPGRDRQREGDAELHQDCRADQRTCRHPPRRRRQSGAAGRRERSRRYHGNPADLGAVQSAAAAIPAGEQGFRQGPARCRRDGGRREDVRGSRQAAGDRQPDGSDHRHDPHEGGIPQREPAALAGAVHQCPLAGRHLEGRGGGADRRRAARAAGYLRLRGRRRQQGHGAPDHGCTAGRRARGDFGRLESAGAGGDHRLHAPVQRHARQCPVSRRAAAGCGSCRRASGPGGCARPAQARERREYRGQGPPFRERASAAEHQAMNVSAPFIQRPIATSLLGVAVMFGGLLGYLWLPVSALPQVDFPTIQVTTQLPGASPDTMASLVTAPLERQFGQIPALQTMTSSSSYGISQITLQFDLNREIDAAAQDVQAAINAAGSALPRNLPYPPIYSKVNPADTPIVTLALTSETVSLRSLSDLADTLLAQRLSEITGVGNVATQGGIKPAVRIQVDLPRLAAYGLSLEDIRQAIVNANVAGPKGAFDGAFQSYTIAANDQLAAAEAYRTLVIAYRNQNPVMLRDVAEVIDGLENAKVSGWFNNQQAVIIDIRRQ